MSSTPQRRLNEDMKPGSYTPAAAMSPNKILDAANNAAADEASKAPKELTEDFDFERDEHFDKEEPDRRKISAGFWAEGEESMGPDEDYYGDDLTSHGHGELEQHRQLREYNRLVAWELPLLNRRYPQIKYT
jgi:small subunit ribosomal protein S35